MAADGLIEMNSSFVSQSAVEAVTERKAEMNMPGFSAEASLYTSLHKLSWYLASQLGQATQGTHPAAILTNPGYERPWCSYRHCIPIYEVIDYGGGIYKFIVKTWEREVCCWSPRFWA